jgi:YbbR domain-containing protein
MKLKERMTENLGLKALSLFLALLLWLSVTARMDGEVRIAVPVQLRNLSPQLLIVNRMPHVIDLRISGPKFLLMQLDKERLAVPLDLEGVGDGVVTFANLERTIPLSHGLRITRIYPSTIELKLEKTTGPSIRP